MLALHVFRLLGIQPPPGLLRLFTRKSIAKGTVLVRAGECWRTACAVESGMLRMYFIRRDGREFNKSFHAEGSLLLPITQAMACQPSLFYAATVEKSAIWTAPAEAVVRELVNHGSWAAVQTQLLSDLVTNKLARERDFLALDGRARYQKLNTEFPELCRRVPLSMLATYIGITDVSLSRIRRATKGN